MTTGIKYPVGSSDDFPEGQIVARTVAGLELVIIRSSGCLSVFEDRCSHQPVKLSEFGETHRGRLICHAHGGVFDIEQGGAVVKGPPCEALRPYQCEEIAGQVSVII